MGVRPASFRPPEVKHPRQQPTVKGRYKCVLHVAAGIDILKIWDILEMKPLELVEIIDGAALCGHSRNGPWIAGITLHITRDALGARWWAVQTL